MATATRLPARPDLKIDQGKIRRDMGVRRVGKLFTLTLAPIVGYFFLWAPIVLLVVFSFNNSKSLARWEGFTLQWYANIFSNVVGGDATFSTSKMLQALETSIIVGITATIISTIIGTMVALSLVRGNFPGKRFLDGLLFPAHRHPGNHTRPLAARFLQRHLRLSGRRNGNPVPARAGHDHHRAYRLLDLVRGNSRAGAPRRHESPAGRSSARPGCE